MPAGLGTLFAGLLLIVLAFVEGSSVWKALHEVLFGLFGCGSFVLGAAICYLAILYTRGEDLIGQMFKLMLGLVFASGTVIVFSEIPADIPAARMVAECYQNGVHAWLGGGAIGALLGGNLLLLCGRPAANLVMVVLALCASLYIFDITPAELWQWMCELGGSAHEKGVAVYEQNAARRAERQAARQAEEEAAALEAGDEPNLCGEEDEEGGFAAPGWLSGIFSWGHKVTKELEGEAVPEPVDDSLGYEAPAPSPAPAPAEPQEAPAFTPVQVGTPHPRASFDIDLGPDSTPVVEGGSEPIEPFIVGPGGTFGQDPLHKPAPRPIVKPVVPDAIETAAEDFFAKPDATAAPEAPAPVVTPGIPAQPLDEGPTEAPAFDGSGAFQTPTLPTTDEPSVPVRVMADNVMAMRSAPDEDGWISITSEPVEEKDINTLVAAAMEKPAVGEQQAATAPAEEPEAEESYQYQYPGIDLFEKAPEESDPNAQDELKANAQKLVDTLESFGVRTRVLDISRGPSVTRYELELQRGVKLSKVTNLADDIALALGASGVRIAPIPDKISVVGIEVPNKIVSTVYLRDIIESQRFTSAKSKLSFALGKDIGGECIVGNIAKLPHMLIAGTTGSGKSVCMNSLILSLLYKARPDEVRLIMIDPKMVELGIYNGIPHLLIPVVTDPKKAAGALNWAVQEMQRRYNLFAENGAAFSPDIEVATSDQILPLVRLDLGVAFLPEAFAAPALQKGEIGRLTLAETIPPRQLLMARRSGQALSIAAKALEAMILG